MNKFLIICFIIFSSILPASVYSASISNVGFVGENIWYSKNAFSEGDTINIHTAIWNGEASEVKMKIEFLDFDTVLGDREIIIMPGELENVFISWKVTAGDHSIKSRILNPTIIIDGKVTPLSIKDQDQDVKDLFVPKKIIKAESGEVLDTSLGEKVTEVLPESISTPVARVTDRVDMFRIETAESIDNLSLSTKERIEAIDKEEAEGIRQQGNLSGTEKPIAYVELFLLNVASFIFSHMATFYILSAFLLFVICRFIYRKITR